MSIDRALLDRVWRRANAERWALVRPDFDAAVEESVARAFREHPPSNRDIDRYLSGLHVEDLALARACMLGRESAWEHFIREHRPVLYRAADAIDPSGGARELADSLYADLYGVTETEGSRRSLFRYFHGRSSLATWLRAVLAQRRVDVVRSRRRTEALPEIDSEALAVAGGQPEPDRRRLVALVQDALGTAIDRLPPKDRLRLRSYYVMELTLAQIGKVAGEHEATVSRHLTRTRRQLRDVVTNELRDSRGLTDAEIARALELSMEDPEDLDLRQLLGSSADRKDAPVERSK